MRNPDSVGNVVSINELTDLIIRDIKQQFGGVHNIETVCINSNGNLIINEYAYSPQLTDRLKNSLGTAVRMDVDNGKIYKIVNMGRLVRTIGRDMLELSIETPKVAYSLPFLNELGVKNDYTVLFKKFGNLETIYLPDGELNRYNPSDYQPSGGGLGSKIANLFGFGKGKKEEGNYTPNPAPEYSGNDTIDRIFESRPVRVMTRALGWTLGVKAVMVAASFFGPWGLLFGAFAAAGAYNECEKDKAGYNNSGYNNNSGRSNSSGTKSKKSTKGKNNSNWDE